MDGIIVTVMECQLLVITWQHGQRGRSGLLIPTRRMKLEVEFVVLPTAAAIPKKIARRRSFQKVRDVCIFQPRWQGKSLCDEQNVRIIISVNIWKCNAELICRWVFLNSSDSLKNTCDLRPYCELLVEALRENPYMFMSIFNKY